MVTLVSRFTNYCNCWGTLKEDTGRRSVGLMLYLVKESSVHCNSLLGGDWFKRFKAHASPVLAQRPKWCDVGSHPQGRDHMPHKVWTPLPLISVSVADYGPNERGCKEPCSTNKHGEDIHVCCCTYEHVNYINNTMYVTLLVGTTQMPACLTV